MPPEGKGLKEARAVILDSNVDQDQDRQEMSEAGREWTIGKGEACGQLELARRSSRGQPLLRSKQPLRGSSYSTLPDLLIGHDEPQVYTST